VDQPGTAPFFQFAGGLVVVGFADSYQRGSGPFPCVTREDQYYRGGPMFDLSEFDTDVLATLTFNVKASVSANGEATVQDPPACNATVLGMGTGTDFYNFDNAVTLPPCGPSQSINVTSQARSWINHSHANFGFILAGPKIDFPNPLPDDNDSSATWHDSFQLVVQYNPALNHHAPQ
jgi:hypothetical protein